MRLPASNLAFISSPVTLKFLIHNFLKTRVLLKIFDAEFPLKCSYFEQRVGKPAKMTVEAVIRSVKK